MGVCFDAKQLQCNNAEPNNLNMAVKKTTTKKTATKAPAKKAVAKKTAPKKAAVKTANCHIRLEAKNGKVTGSVEGSGENLVNMLGTILNESPQLQPLFLRALMAAS